MTIGRVGVAAAVAAVWAHACGGNALQQAIGAASGSTMPAQASSAVCPNTSPSIDPAVAMQDSLCDASRFDVIPNLAYGANAAHVLDLYKPRDATSPPTIVWIHGAGRQNADARNVREVQTLICRGYAVASIHYRSNGEAAYPSQIYDVKAAIGFLRAHASAYQLNPERFAVFGSSADVASGAACHDRRQNGRS